MNPPSVWVVFNEHDYILRVYGTKAEAESNARIFTKNNKDSGYSMSEHRVVEYILPRGFHPC